MRRWLPALLFLGVAAATSAACKAKAGGECKTEAKLACEDATTALACHGGKWERETCRGPKGCAQKGSDAECDHATAENGDACSVEGDHSCTADKKAMVRCAGYRWGLVATCLGPAGCVRSHEASCDNSRAAVDDPCTKEADIACTLDTKATVTCSGGKMVTGMPCRGPSGCSVSGATMHCDDSLSEVGDACASGGKDHYSCSGDSRSILKCDGGKYVLSEKCAGKKSCKLLGDAYGCSL